MKLICIQCPMGCHLEVDERLKVTGNSCPRGEKYAMQEMSHPMRTLTTTVRTNSQIHRQLPVITKNPIPKEKMMEVMKSLKDVEVQVPIHIFDVIVENVCGLGTDLIASRDLLQ